ncbi:MAG TPA: protease complex subunit PrcB family protein [Longimicrobiales bacterium]
MGGIRIRYATALAAVPFLIWGCKDPDVTGLPPEAARVPDEQVTTVVRALYTGLKAPAREVIRTQQAWAAFWEQLHADQHPRPPLPPVDFDESIVIAVAMGEQPSGGYAIDVEGVYRTESRLHVVVRETSPGRSCVTPAVVLTPVVAILTQRTEDEVTFVERKTVHECE